MKRAAAALRGGLWGVLIGSIALLAACGGDDSGSGQPTTPPGQTSTTYGFEPYLQQLVKQSSCDTSSPVTTTNVNFVFAADQDTAEPRDLSTVTPGCTP